jgi:hypothetical protein
LVIWRGCFVAQIRLSGLLLKGTVDMVNSGVFDAAGCKRLVGAHHRSKRLLSGSTVSCDSQFRQAV